MTPEKHSCPFCGRFSAQEPQLRAATHTHRIDQSSAGNFFVLCWYCSASGPLSGTAREAVKRWGSRGETGSPPVW